MSNYYLHGTTGAATPITDLTTALNSFLTLTAGWTLAEPAFTGTTGAVGTGKQHQVYKSPARVSTDYATIIVVADIIPVIGTTMYLVGWYGDSDAVNHWNTGLTLGFDDAARVGTPGLYLPAANNITVNAGATEYWFFADEYQFKVITNVGATYPTGYAGFIDSGYVAVTDPYPLLVKGNLGVASWQTEGLGCRMFDAGGVPENYSAMNPTWHAGAAFMEGIAGVTVQPSTRVAPPTYEAIEPILATRGAIGAKPELRGVPRGVVRVNNTIGAGNTIVLPNGQTYVVFDSHGYGPVV